MNYCMKLLSRCSIAYFFDLLLELHVTDSVHDHDISLLDRSVSFKVFILDLIPFAISERN